MDASQKNTPNAADNVPAQTNPSRIQIAVQMIRCLFRWLIWRPIAVSMGFLCGCACLVCGSAKNGVTIQLYCAQETFMTDYALTEVKKKLTSHLFYSCMRLPVMICENISSIQRDMPLIVICLSSSRLGVDFRSAISGVPTGSKTAVLICHHLQEHALPTESSDTILTKDEVSNVGIIIDVAFFETMGMYDCDMNKNAYKTLIKFIKDKCK